MLKQLSFFKTELIFRRKIVLGVPHFLKDCQQLLLAEKQFILERCRIQSVFKIFQKFLSHILFLVVILLKMMFRRLWKFIVLLCSSFRILI
jgi:hypothetical protein